MHYSLTFSIKQLRELIFAGVVSSSQLSAEMKGHVARTCLWNNSLVELAQETGRRGHVQRIFHNKGQTREKGNNFRAFFLLILLSS